MTYLRESVDSQILIVTYDENLKNKNTELLNKCKDIDIWIESIKNHDGLLKKIQLFKLIDLLNKNCYATN